MTGPAPDEMSPEHPLYAKIPQDTGTATQLFMIICDEGWRQSIVCCDMYEFAADWFLSFLTHRPPYAPDRDSAPAHPVAYHGKPDPVNVEAARLRSAKYQEHPWATRAMNSAADVPGLLALVDQLRAELDRVRRAPR